MVRRILAACLASLLAAPAAFPGDDPKEPPPRSESPPEKAPGAKSPDATAAGTESKKEPPKEPAKDGKDAAKPATAKPAADPLVAARSPRSKREALLYLERTIVSVNFEGTLLADAVNHLAAVTGVNMIVATALRREADVDVMRVDLRLTKVSARQVLELMTEGKELGIGFQSGVLTVTTRKEARGKPVLRLHALGDLTMVLRDFPAPDLILRPAGAERAEEEVVETKHPFGDADEILRMVKDNTGKGTWEDEAVSASVMGEWLVVKQYEEVQAEIGKLLGLLRSAR